MKKYAPLTAALALITALALTSCTTTTPGPTPTPTETASETATPEPTTVDENAYTTGDPTGEEQAITDATTALDKYLALEGDIVSSDDPDTSRAEVLATGQVLEELKSQIQTAEELGHLYDGQRTFTVDSDQTVVTATTDQDGEVVTEFGSVNFYGCMDLTTLGGTSTETGDPLEYTGETASFPVHINVYYDANDGRWLTQFIDQDWENGKTRC